MKIITSDKKGKQRKLLSWIILLCLTVGITFTACEGPQGPQGPQGPRGPRGPQGPPGESNTKVTLYILDGHDFTKDDRARYFLHNITQKQMKHSTWKVYLVYGTGRRTIYFSIPGRGYHGDARFTTYHRMSTQSEDSPVVQFVISLIKGEGAKYRAIRIIRIRISNKVDNTKTASANIDYSNYKEVANYYGLNTDDAVYVH